ncbi:AraD1 family protein [Herbaspirillum rhizosphaerae]|uniref:AraD1 family protein n=1 Tax=Herbaspirillum rhizosphaerae TaxID=346179 RepID=UPI00067DACA7|nr:AraD1 family protein [Herbaspirillum rhizosphaerae]
MRLIQFEDRQGGRKVGIVNGKAINVVSQVGTMRELALLAIAEGNSLERQAQLLNSNTQEDYAAILKENRILAPLDHEDPAHCLVSGTGLTHLGSAATRDKMHQKLDDDESAMTDTMRMFKWGLEGGRPGRGKVGAQPEWFYKGDGDIVVNPGAAFPMPEFAEDAGEEPELTGLYIIDNDGRPHRLGFAIGNEFSDHVVERKNYLYLAHSKLRYCSFGPELLVGDLPTNLVGMSRIRRDGRVIWEKEFLSGQDNMCHAIENLEYHHFKYNQFLRPGDIHVHFFGTATLSFADGVRTQLGDCFEISLPDFGEPLVNGIAREQSRIAIDGIKVL